MSKRKSEAKLASDFLACKRAFALALDNTFTQLAGADGYDQRTVVLAAICQLMLCAGAQITNAIPDHLRQYVRDRALVEFHLGLAEVELKSVSGGRE
jgi:hypothetical protein